MNSNLDVLNVKTLISGEWINNLGEIANNKNMVRTKILKYSPMKDYSITGSASVAYFKGEKFIKSERFTGKKADMPFYLEKVFEADNIILSFHIKWLGTMKLTKS